MIDYNIFYKSVLPGDGEWGPEARWHTFISAFTSADRVRRVFKKAVADEKRWIVFPEYGYEKDKLPEGAFCVDKGKTEAEGIQSFWESLEPGIENKEICVDITGFIRPYLIFLVRWLMEMNVQRFDAVYSEPDHYREREETSFSGESVKVVRQIAGYEGNHKPETSNDVLIINVGYDHQLISHVAENKDQANKFQLFGFPSLRADMYQENVLRAYEAKEAVGSQAKNYFAPANNPFVTASVLSEIVDTANKKKPITNLYLSPLATKPQVLGFALYYLTERRNTSSSMIFPFCDAYNRETGVGVARVWKYTVELPPK